MPSVKLTLAEANVAVKELLGCIEAETVESESSAKRVLLAERLIKKFLEAFPEVIEIPSFIEEDLYRVRPWIEDAKRFME